MPDLANKLSTKSSTLKKSQSTSSGTKAVSSTKGRDHKKSGGGKSGSHSPPPKHRVQRRSRSSSDSESSDSSDSRSHDSSDSHSSHSTKEPPKKTARLSESKTDRLKPVKRSAESLPTKAVTSSSQSKQQDNKVHREPKKLVSGSNTDPVKESDSRIEAAFKPPATDGTATRSSKPPTAGEKSPNLETAGKDVTRGTGKQAKEAETDKVVKNQGDVSCDLPKFTCVLVEKLTRNVNKGHISEIFSVWGEIEHVDMPADRLHPEFSRSYAYVHYRQPNSAADAVNYMNGGQIDGEIVRVTEVLSRNAATADSRNSTSVRKEGPNNIEDRPYCRDRDPDSTRAKDIEKTGPGSTRTREDHAPSSRRMDDSVPSERHRDHGPTRDDDRDTEFDRRRDARMRERERDRQRDRERERERRERDRLRDRERDRSRMTGPLRRTRRGSSGSPFATRSGGTVNERQRSPVVTTGSSRHRRPSPPVGSRSDRSPARRGRSRSPLSKPNAPRNAALAGGNSATGDKNAPSRRGRRGTSRSSSSSSSDSSSSSSSSSSASSGSRSGSGSSSSSSSSRSRS